MSEDSVSRAYKKFVEQGEAGFLGGDNRKGTAHKMIGELKERIQRKLDKGQSVNSMAKEEGIRESTIRYNINQGYFKKKERVLNGQQGVGSNLNERNQQDASAPLGMATTRYEGRIASATQGTGHAVVKFESYQGICGAGVLFLLPALLSQGLLKTKEIYQVPPTHYYSLESIVLTLAFMALARIKNPEQLKQRKPGEIGKIIGLNRIPEVRYLRDKIKLLSSQGQAQQLNRLLVNEWYRSQSEEGSFLYIDGHQRIYYGHKTNLPVKYISRQELCLAATTEYYPPD